MRELGVDLVFVVPHRELVVLCHAAQHVQQRLQRVVGSEVGRKQRDAGVLQVVEAADAAQEQRFDAVVLLIDGDAPWFRVG